MDHGPMQELKINWNKMTKELQNQFYAEYAFYGACINHCGNSEVSSSTCGACGMPRLKSDYDKKNTRIFLCYCNRKEWHKTKVGDPQMTQPKDSPAIEPRRRRPNFTVSTAPETKEFLDAQPTGKGHAIDFLYQFWLDHQPITDSESENDRKI